MIVTYIREPGQKLTQEQINRIREAAKRPITPDEDCPELSPEQLEQLRQAVRERNRRLRAQGIEPPTDRTLECI